MRIVIGARGEGDQRARFKEELTPETFALLPYVRRWGVLPAGMWAWEVKPDDTPGRVAEIEAVPMAADAGAPLLAGVRGYLEREESRRLDAERRSPLAPEQINLIYARARATAAEEIARAVLQPVTAEITSGLDKITDEAAVNAELDKLAEHQIRIYTDHGCYDAQARLREAEDQLIAWARSVMEGHEQYKAQREEMAHVWEVKSVKLRLELVEICMKLRAPRQKKS